MEALPRTLITIRLLAIAALCLSCAPQVLAQETNLVELTQSDLFSSPNWRSRTVAINGFVLGMTREHALEMAEAKKLRLIPREVKGLTIAQMRGPCTQASCSVYKAQGNWIGIYLFFDTEKINKIEVGLSADMDPEAAEVNITGKFKGFTYQFFNHYSEQLRNQILGSAEAKRDDSMPRDTDHLKYVQYEYSKSGMVVRVTTNDGEPIDLAVDFLLPQ